MIEKDITEIVPQIPGENDSSYCRLIIMLKKGFRTLKELHDYLEKENHKYYVKYSTLKYNSTKDNWQQRKQKYYNIRDQELREEVEELFQQLNTQGIHDMAQYIDELQELKKHVLTQFREQGYKASSTLKILKDYTYCYRQATEIYYINSRHTLTPDTTNTSDEVDAKKLNEFDKLINGACKE